jgi:hypothetical protein
VSASNAVIVDFPLRGEWVPVHSPATRIPSHGTDQLGQRYAFDFWRVDERRSGYHPARTLRLILWGVPTNECYGYGEPIHTAFDGEVVRAEDGYGERNHLHPARELWRLLRTAATFRPERAYAVAGNHVVVRGGDYYGLYAHLAPGSVQVSPGAIVQAGEVLGTVGSTGNSTAPHLHFQLMDSVDPVRAAGVACRFREYETRREGRWELVEGGIPAVGERIRSVR